MPWEGGRLEGTGAERKQWTRCTEAGVRVEKRLKRKDEGVTVERVTEERRRTANAGITSL